MKKNPEVKYIIVSSIDRIHRNCRSLLEIIEKLKAIDVEVITVDEFDLIKSCCEV
ncbi:MAG: recombinase family protein [Porcipelethomonas sp.]